MRLVAPWRLPTARVLKESTFARPYGSVLFLQMRTKQPAFQ
jgi:hypothetical protein